MLPQRKTLLHPSGLDIDQTPTCIFYNLRFDETEIVLISFRVSQPTRLKPSLARCK
jgi:hypothetical protein